MGVGTDKVSMQYQSDVMDDLYSEKGYDWSGAWEGFKSNMASKYGEKAGHAVADLAFGGSSARQNKETGYMTPGSVGSAMAKGAISGAIAGKGNPYTAMAGAAIAGLTTSLEGDKIRKQNQALEQYKKGMVKAETTQEKAKMYGERGQQKAAAMRGLGQTMSQALLG